MITKNTRFLVGTSGWTYPQWKGLFYPEGWPQSRWFEYYITKFATVEVNATFYRWFKDPTYHKWRARAPAGFRYVLKAPKLITHRKYLKDVREQIGDFCRSAALLEDRLGLILLQLAPNMPHDLDLLRSALLEFDDPRKIAVEFRHQQWFVDETRNLLEELGSVFCTADSPKTKLMNWVTSEVAYIRLHGRRRWYAHDYSRRELAEIADLAREMVTAGAKTIYIFFNNDSEGNAPKNALTLQEMLT